MPCVVFRGDDVVFVGDPVIFYDCIPDTPAEDHGFTLSVNGADYPLTGFNGEQLRSLRLADAAFDAQIASGTFVVPGAPGWVAGDRLAFYADDASNTFIGNYFVTDRGQKRQSIETGAIETAYTITDTNRLLIGWYVIDFVTTGTGPEIQPTRALDVINAIIDFLNAGPAVTSLDSTTWVDNGDVTPMLNKVYNSDGASDMIGDLIIYTAKTVFLRATADAEYELHFHALHIGPVSDIGISDSIDDALRANYFSPVNASLTYSATDLKTNIQITNSEGVIVGGGDAGHTGPHSTGGLRWDFQGAYGVSEDDLGQFANVLIDTGGLERPTASCTIGPLTGAQLANISAGSQPLALISEVIDIEPDAQFVKSRSASIWNDAEGNPVPGLWNVELEFAYPQRQPTATIGYGGQGGYSGLLNDPFNQGNHFTTYYGDVWPPVGTQSTAVTQLQGTNGEAVTQQGIQTLITLEQFLDEAETMPCNDFSLTGVGDPPVLGQSTLTGGTDRVGQVTYDISHDVDTGCVKMRVTATYA